MLITSLDNEKVKKYRKLQKKKYRDIYGEFIVEGEHLVVEAYKKGLLDELILLDDVDFNLPVPKNYYTSEIISKISAMDTPSSIMGVCHKNICNDLVGSKILILDQLQDPGNLGTIIRSAVAFNVDTIVLSENTVDLYNPKVLRATQGMIFHINIISNKIEEIIAVLHNLSIPVYGTDVNGGIDVRSLTTLEKEKYALIVGNEGNGVLDDIKALCDKNLYINMNSSVESLNVAIATSILLYELGR